MLKLSRNEYMGKFPDVFDEPEFIGVDNIYLSDIPTCPYRVYEYADGSVWVYGAGEAKELKCEEIEWYLSQEEMYEID